MDWCSRGSAAPECRFPAEAFRSVVRGWLFSDLGLGGLVVFPVLFLDSGGIASPAAERGSFCWIGIGPFRGALLRFRRIP